MKGSWFASGCLILFLAGEGAVQRQENGEDLLNLHNTKPKVWVTDPTAILVSAQTAKTHIGRAWAFIHLFPEKQDTLEFCSSMSDTSAESSRTVVETMLFSGWYQMQVGHMLGLLSKEDAQ